MQQSKRPYTVVLDGYEVEEPPVYQVWAENGRAAATEALDMAADELGADAVDDMYDVVTLRGHTDRVGPDET